MLQSGCPSWWESSSSATADLGHLRALSPGKFESHRYQSRAARIGDCHAGSLVRRRAAKATVLRQRIELEIEQRSPVFEEAGLRHRNDAVDGAQARLLRRQSLAHE